MNDIVPINSVIRLVLVVVGATFGIKATEGQIDTLVGAIVAIVSVVISLWWSKRDKTKWLNTPPPTVPKAKSISWTELADRYQDDQRNGGFVCVRTLVCVIAISLCVMVCVGCARV
jgi:ribose/xylose/arabinose/galactoside ABC-type transport system permease subunit